MKKLYLILFLLLFSSCQKKKQGLQELYTGNFSMMGTSSEMLQLLISEYNYEDSSQSIKLAKEIIKNQEVEQTGSLNLRKHLEIYGEAYRAVTLLTKDDKLLTLATEQSNLQNIPVFTNFSKNKGEEDFKYLVPLVVKSAMRISIDSLTKETLTENLLKPTREYITARIAVLTKNGETLSNIKFEDFSKRFGVAKHGLKAIDNTTSFGRLLTMIAFKNLDITFLDIKKSPKSESIIALKTTPLNKILRQLEQSTELLTKEKVKQITISMDVLVTNEQTAIKSTSEILNHAKALNLSADSIKEIILDRIESKTAATKVAKLQRDYYRFSKASFYLTKIAKEYQEGQLDTRVLLSSLDNKYITSLLNVNKGYASIKQSLKSLSDVNFKTISSVSLQICNTMELTTSQLQTMKILKGKDAERVGKFMRYLSSSIKIGTGTGKLFGGDPSGVFDLLSGISSIMGKSSGPSAESQMMQYMESRFDNVDQQLSSINTKIDSLTSLTLALFKDVNKNFQYVYFQLDEMKDDLIGIKERINQMALKSYYNCSGIYNSASKKTQFNRYSEFVEGSQFNGICLVGLHDVSTPGLDLDFYWDLNPGKNPSLQVRGFLNKQVEPLVKYINNKFPDKEMRTKTAYSALFPMINASYKKPNEVISSLYLKNPHLFNENLPDSLLNRKLYINDEFLFDVGQKYLSNAPYFEMQTNELDFKPYSKAEYLERTKENKMEAAYLFKRRLYFLSHLTKIALMQQSILSGNDMLYTLKASLTTGDTKENKENAMNCLKDNAILKFNYLKLVFSKQIIQKNPELMINYADLFYQNSIQDVKKRDESIYDFNKRLRKIGLRNYIGLSVGSNQNLVFTFSSPGTNIMASLDAPDPQDIESDKFMQSNGVYNMLNLQQRLRSKIAGINFNSYLAENADLNSQNVLKALYTLNRK